jgi:hypothetical protein
MAGGYVQVDETPIDYLEPGYGRARQGYLWTGSRPHRDNHLQKFKFCELAENLRLSTSRICHDGTVIALRTGVC